MKIKTLTYCLPLTILAAAIGLTVSQSQDKNETKTTKITENLPAESPAKPKEKRKVLVFSKTNGFRHGSIPTGIQAMELLGKKTGAFEITATEDEGAFEPDNLKQYHAVLMLNTTGEVFKPKEMPKDDAGKKVALEREERLKKSLLDFVNGGGGLAGIHAATDTYKNWKEYTDMMGGAFAGHPWHELVSIKNMAPEHPINAAFGGKDFEVADEIYQYRDDTASPKDRKMLLALSADKTDLKKGKYGEDGLYPISWLRTYGEGRTFYCSLGHRDEIFWNPAVMQHYLAGLQYVLGDLEADATVAAAPGAVIQQSPVVVSAK
ncbi:MAG: type 1 glutamine amidotransferase [Verrucomicrobiales bacterium]|jgi:type 1 glutamine amidotransferase